MKKHSRVLALLMALALSVSLFSGAVFASEEPTEEVQLDVAAGNAFSPMTEEPAEEETTEDISETEPLDVDGAALNVSSSVVSYGAFSAVFQVKISRRAENVSSAQFWVLYREEGTQEWSSEYSDKLTVKDLSATVEVVGLEPGKIYEYRGVYAVNTDGGNDFTCYTREAEEHTFTTEQAVSVQSLGAGVEVKPAEGKWSEYAFTAPADGTYVLTATNADWYSCPGGIFPDEEACDYVPMHTMNKDDVWYFRVYGAGEDSTVKVDAYTLLNVEELNVSVADAVVDGTTAKIKVTYSVPMGSYFLANITYAEEQGYYIRSEGFGGDTRHAVWGECKDEVWEAQLTHLFPGYTYDYTVHTYTYDGKEDTNDFVSGSITVPETTQISAISVGTTKMSADSGEVYFKAPASGVYEVTLPYGEFWFGQDGEVTSREGAEDNSTVCSFTLEKNDKLYIGYDLLGDSTGSIRVEKSSAVSDGDTNKVNDLYICNGVVYFEYDMAPEGYRARIYLKEDDRYLTETSSVTGGEGCTLTTKVPELLIPGVSYTFLACICDDEVGYSVVEDELTIVAEKYDVPDLPLGECFEIDKAAVYSLTPAESGWYRFTKGDWDQSYVLYNDAGELLLDGGSYGNASLQCFAHLEKDETYYLRAESSLLGTLMVEAYTPEVTEDVIHSVTAEISGKYALVTVEYSRTLDSPWTELDIGFGELYSNLLSGEVNHGVLKEYISVFELTPNAAIAPTARFANISEEGASVNGEVVTWSITPIVLTEDQTVELEEGTTALYTFTPAETGKYSLNFNVTRGDGCVTVTDAADGSCVKDGEFYEIGADEDEYSPYAELTSGHTYNIVIKSSASCAASLTVAPQSTAVTADSVDAIEVTETEDAVEVTVTFHAMCHEEGYYLSAEISDADGYAVTASGTPVFITEKDGASFTFSFDKSEFVPGGKYDLEVRMNPLGMGDAYAEKSVCDLTWPSYEAVKLELNEVVTESSNVGTYTFTAPKTGLYTFKGNYADFAVRNSTGSCFSNETGVFEMKEGKTFYMDVNIWDEGSFVITEFEKKEIVLSVNSGRVIPGEEVEICVTAISDERVGPLVVELGTPVDKEVTLYGAWDTISYTIPETMENGDTITLSVKSLTDGEDEPVSGYDTNTVTLTVDAHIPADTNGDGETDLMDLVHFIKYFADKTSVKCEAYSTDLNGDGDTDAKDLVRMTRYLAGYTLKIN